MILVLTGVAGAGKTTIGRALAQRFSVAFFDADDFHLASSRRKMETGVPLTEADREPWLNALRELIADVLSKHGNAVLACSALRRNHRQFLARDGVTFVHLRVSREVARERVQARKGHFFDPRLLDSQFEALEEGDSGVAVDADQPVEEVVEDIIEQVKPFR